MKKKRSMELFLRSFKLSAVVVFCLIIGVYGICSAYSAIRQIGFGEYRSAIEIEEESIKILDFEIKLN